MKRSGIKLKKSKKPPRTRRFCAFCDKHTEFEYNRNVGHSFCMFCGYRHFTKDMNKLMYGKNYNP